MAIVTTMTTKLIEQYTDKDNLLSGSDRDRSRYIDHSIQELYESIGDRYINYVYNNNPINITKDDSDIRGADKQKRKDEKITER